MLYSFARVSAVLGMRRQDYFGQGSRGWLRLHEKGGKRHDVPAHHRAAEGTDQISAEIQPAAVRAARRTVALGRAAHRRMLPGHARGAHGAGAVGGQVPTHRGRTHRNGAH